MIFNIIALSSEYNKKFLLYFDEEYPEEYFKQKQTIRKSSKEYNIFKKIQFKKIDENILNTFKIYNELEYKYNKILLNKNDKYNINGYFQSYKYVELFKI